MNNKNKKKVICVICGKEVSRTRINIHYKVVHRIKKTHMEMKILEDEGRFKNLYMIPIKLQVKRNGEGYENANITFPYDLVRFYNLEGGEKIIYCVDENGGLTLKIVRNEVKIQKI